MISQPFTWHTWSLTCCYISPLRPVSPHLPDFPPTPEVSLSIPYMLACPVFQICSFHFLPPFTPGAFLGAQWWRICLPVQEMQETWVQSLGQEDSLEKEVVIHSSILAWRIPWTEEPGGVESMGSQRIGHNLIAKILITRIHSPHMWFHPMLCF